MKCRVTLKDGRSAIGEEGDLVSNFFGGEGLTGDDVESVERYPTEWAYEQACKALEAQRERAVRAEGALQTLMAISDQVAIAFNTHLAALLEEDGVERVQASWGDNVLLLGDYRDVRNELDPGVPRPEGAGRAELQAAVDRAHSLMNGSAYVGGPTEREAWQGAMEALGSVVTQHKSQPEGATQAELNGRTVAELDG